MPIAAGILTILALALVAMVVITKRGSSSEGRLSRETRSRDSATQSTTPAGSALEAVETADARARAGETRAGTTMVARDAGTVTEWQPLDPEELSMSRRMFFNRAILSVGGLGALPAFGAALLAFLWPSGVGGFGSKVNTSLAEATKTWTEKKEPFYVPAARTYLQPYPTDVTTLKAAKKIYDPAVTSGMEAGVVALYQKCVHLGCRVPGCSTAQWFECPCHGSKYDRIGEKRDGPAPRGLDHWPITISGDNILIDTSGAAIPGPPIGTDTTKQAAEGPHCV